jgi:hypothetical protein
VSTTTIGFSRDNEADEAALAGAPVALRMATVTSALWFAASIVILLGWLRELIIPIIGTGTVLQDLRHIAFDAEHCLPAWFESLNMALAALLLGLCALLSRVRDPLNTRHWALLAAIFLYMSIDEAIAIHEVTMAPLREALHLSGYLYFAWILIAAPLLLLLGWSLLPFLFRLPVRTALGFVMSGSLFVFAAVVLESVGGHLVDTLGWHSSWYVVASSTEESLEIVAVVMFVCQLLRVVSGGAERVTLRLKPESAPSRG